MAFCPTCHSNIGSGSLSEAQRVQGAQGEDSGDRPVPRWSDDPLLTAKGLNGTTFVGGNKVRAAHITELQERITALEIEVGLTPTEFSDIDEDKHIIRRHIIELREATERLLAFGGQTLVDYFKNDDDENEAPQNPRLSDPAYGAAAEQDEWIDVERGEPYIHNDGTVSGTFVLPDTSVVQSPTLPSRAAIRAVHIEDLRHPISVGVPALLLDRGSISFLAFSPTQIYEGKKDRKSNFTGVKVCTDAPLPPP